MPLSAIDARYALILPLLPCQQRAGAICCRRHAITFEALHDTSLCRCCRAGIYAILLIRHYFMLTTAVSERFATLYTARVIFAVDALLRYARAP